MTPPGLYVHIPFCSVKCFYCDFTAFSGQGRTVERYLAALEAEAALVPVSTAPDTLYIGGGTPSELTAGQTSDLFARIRRAFPGSSWREATFEANPESLDAGKLAALKAAGVTRLSLGLQTLDDALLKSIGRRHTAAEFVARFAEAKAAGLAVSVDLMYGLPGQTLESCARSLEEVIALEPEHLSLYGLHVEDLTLFAKRGVEPDEDLGRAMFETCLGRLAAAGFAHYEISNFAKPGRESLHNLNYWANGDYLGLGCGAASHLGGERSSNIDRLLPYCEAVESGRRPVAETERLEGKARLGESALLALRRLDGLELTDELEAGFGPELASLGRRGLLTVDGRRARLSREGVFVANAVFREFVAPFGANA